MILLFYKHCIVGAGGKARVWSQRDGELTSETAVLYLQWDVLSKRYEPVFMSKRRLFSLTPLTSVCGGESSVRATANSKCPENCDAFKVFFSCQKQKVYQCLILAVSLVRKWLMMGTKRMVLCTRSLKAVRWKSFPQPS